MNIRIASASALLALSALATPAFAQSAGHDHHAASMAAAPARADEVAAEVRALDAARGRITLRHGALTHLGMPGMTMPFALAQGLALPAGLKPGDKVTARIEDRDGTLTVTAIRR